MKFIIENKNDIIQSDLAHGQFYGKEELDVMMNFCPPKSHILDVGANVGSHTIYFSKFFDAEIIYAIEPIPAAYKMLLANLCLNYCHNVNVDYVGYALGHDNMLGFPIEIYPNNLGSTRLVQSQNEAKRIAALLDFQQISKDPVQIVRGDDFFADKRIDFIKIDAETMELVILQGLSTTISINRPNMFVEVCIENSEDFHAWIANNNYEIVWEKIYPRLYCNFIIIPMEKIK